MTDAPKSIFISEGRPGCDGAPVLDRDEYGNGTARCPDCSSFMVWNDEGVKGYPV